MTSFNHPYNILYLNAMPSSETGDGLSSSLQTAITNFSTFTPLTIESLINEGLGSTEREIWEKAHILQNMYHQMVPSYIGKLTVPPTLLSPTTIHRPSGNYRLKEEYQRIGPMVSCTSPTGGLCDTEDYSQPKPGRSLLTGTAIPLTNNIFHKAIEIIDIRQSHQSNCAFLAVLASIICLGNANYLYDLIFDDNINIYVKLYEPQIESGNNNPLTRTLFTLNTYKILKLPKNSLSELNIEAPWLNILVQAYQPYTETWVEDIPRGSKEEPIDIEINFNSNCQEDTCMYRLLPNIQVFTIEYPLIFNKYAHHLGLLQFAIQKVNALICWAFKATTSAGTFVKACTLGGITNNIPRGLVPSHAYAVCGIIDCHGEAEEAVPKLLLYNPWGQNLPPTPLPTIIVSHPPLSLSYIPRLTLGIDKSDLLLYDLFVNTLNKIVQGKVLETPTIKLTT
jgi:hypothetical protein